uniref:P/Homo B domain-containing protein n=1 Tax=Meloidogyne javanica TaxID=6303 RepID=A0A915LH37_MELJA
MVVKGEPFLDSHYFLSEDKTGLGAQRRRKRSLESIQDRPEVAELIVDRPRRRVKRDYIEQPSIIGPLEEAQSGRKRRQTTFFERRPVPKLPFPDPLYSDQWYLIGRAVGGFDMNVREAWLMGYAGRNVSISILDDGIQRDHPDLVHNYDPYASTDINDHDADPTPQNNGDNKHGTRCAGEVAAIAGNDVCGVGVAFLSKIGGVRMLDGPVSDSVEAASLNLNQQHIDIYSARIKQGRGGKGNIFVWASGNGGSRQDSCSADGYTTSIYTLSISSATFDNHKPWYLEECPSSIATTYSSANINQPAIVTVDVPIGCTKMHTGTSASAPLAAGIIALALEANPSLTWRDMQHIVLRTANPNPLLNNPGWAINGVGRRISNKFGYGLMDAGALVKLARVWQTVPEQHMCTYEYILDAPRPRPITGRFAMNFSLEVTGCLQGLPVLYIEHIQVITTIRFGKRGDLKLTLFSPMGTRSVLLPPRPQDYNQNGFHKWPFLTVQMWGEDPRGIWTLLVESISTNMNIGGIFSDWTMLLYGTEEPAQPSDQRYGPYNSQQFHRPSSGGIGQPSQVGTNNRRVNGGGGSGNLNKNGGGGSGGGWPEIENTKERDLDREINLTIGYFEICVSHCDTGFYADGDKCKRCSSDCETCSSGELCDTCHGAKLLIDVKHYGHLDHGRCVDSCPSGLVAVYKSTIQAKCVLKINTCAAGYFQSDQATGVCLDCDKACALCHGPGPLQCDQCAPGYGNSSIGEDSESDIDVVIDEMEVEEDGKIKEEDIRVEENIIDLIEKASTSKEAV